MGEKGLFFVLVSDSKWGGRGGAGVLVRWGWVGEVCDDGCIYMASHKDYKNLQQSIKDYKEHRDDYVAPKRPLMFLWSNRAVPLQFQLTKA